MGEVDKPSRRDSIEADLPISMVEGASKGETAKFGVLCALEACADPKFQAWAAARLDGTDVSDQSARTMADAADLAASEIWKTDRPDVALAEAWEAASRAAKGAVSGADPIWSLSVAEMTKQSLRSSEKPDVDLDALAAAVKSDG